MVKSDKKSRFDTAIASSPPSKKVKKDKGHSDEALDKWASSEKEKIEVEHLALTKEKVKKRKKAVIEPLVENKGETRSPDFKVEVATALVMVSQTKTAKNGKRDNEDETKKRKNSKKQKVEVENVVLSNKKSKELKKALTEPIEKKDKTRRSDFESEVDTAPTSVPPTKKVKKDEAPGKRSSSKKEKVEVEQGSLVNEKIKKLKKAFIESPREKGVETESLDFEGEVAAANYVVLQMKPAKKGKRANDGETEKQASSKKQKINLEVESNKKVNKLKEALAEPMVETKDGTCSLDFKEEPRATANQDPKFLAKRVFVGNLSPDVIKDDLLNFFKEAGEVVEVHLAAKADGSFRGFGHIEFATAADAQRALGLNYQLLLGRRVMIDFAVEKGSNNPPKGKGVLDSAHCIYVKGFGKSLGEDQVRHSLKEHFGSCGEIIRVSIPQDSKTGRSKGFAYISFNDQATVSKALELNGTELGSYTLTVEQPVPRGGARDGAYGGGRGSRGRSADRGGDRGEDGRGRGRGRRGAWSSYNSATTVGKGLL